MTYVKLKKVGLDFPLPSGRFKTAIHDVSLTARAGDRVGLIGQNGAGKTTMLRLINGVYSPTRGRLYRSGKVGSMINASVGMDMKSSAMDNLTWRARQNGLSKVEIDRLLKRTIEFTELGDRFSDPLRTFSAGMMARVAFSIATAFEADIYLLDEWLSAGDSRFKDKSQTKMEELLTDDKILFFASHSDGMIRDWCNKVLLMHDGRPVAFTNVFDGFLMMHELMRGLSIEEVREAAFNADAGWAKTSLKVTEPSDFSSSTGGLSELAKPADIDIVESLDGDVKVVVQGDFRFVTSKSLIKTEPGMIYRAKASVTQTSASSNSRPSGAFVGFVALDETGARLSQAYHIARFAADLKPHHGNVEGACDFATNDFPGAKFLRYYVGANYAGSAPHSDGAAEIKNMAVLSKLS